MAEQVNATIRISVVDAFSAPLRQFATALEGVKGKMEGIRKSFALAADLNQAAEAMGRFSSSAVAGLRAPVDEFKAFEVAMDKVSALTNEVGTENFERMKAAAQDLGATTSYSAVQAAEAMGQFGQQGREVNEILRMTPQALALARGGMIDIAEGASIMGVVMAGMRMEATEATRVVDVLTLAANAANTDVRGLGDAFSYVGPVASDANLSFEMTAAMLGKLADAGMDSNRAGTGLRGVMSRLLSPSKEATKALAAFGLSAKQIAELQKAAATGKLDESLRLLGEAGAKLPDETRLKLLSDIFGQETQSAASALISAKMDLTSGKGLDALVVKLEKAQGAAMRTAAIMDDNLAGELERTAGAISDLSIKIGERLRPSIMQAAAGIQENVDKLAQWVEKNPELANSILRVTAVLVGGALAMKGLMLAGSAMVSTFAILRGSIVLTQAAWVGMRAVIVGLPASLAAARTAMIAFDASLNGAAALTALKFVGLAAAAGLAGYAIGTWINDATGASDKLADAFAWLLGEDYSDRKKGKSSEQEYGDGTVVDSATGKVVKLGTGPASAAPKFVRDARAAGATSVEDINDFKSARDAAKGFAATGQVAPSAPRAGGMGALLPAGPLDDAATREQTVVLERALREQTDATKALHDEVRRGRRPGRIGATGAGEGGL